jgi:hypothetical protein
VGDEELASVLYDVTAALSEPLSDEDRKGGWTEASRTHWHIYFHGMLAAVEPEDAGNHLIRWLDHDGIMEGPLWDRIETVQRLLRESRLVNRTPDAS